MNSTRPDALTGYGIFFGTNSVHNRSYSNDETGISKHRAELQAVIMALLNVKDVIANGAYNVGSHINQIVIKTDSAYVVKSMTDWIGTWRSNGYKNHQGGDLLNKWDMSTLDRVCNALGDLGIQVCFLEITHAQNGEARRLANEAIY